jgi:pseudaminic acid cytidylyltransferase
MNNLAIIPARGGSKRIERKNIKSFLGEPIISYSINKAIDSKLFKEIIVSTDDFEIKNIAINYGASVPFMRSTINSDDYATTMDVIQEVVNNLASQGKYFDYVCCIYPTAPLIDIYDLLKGFELIQNNNVDMVLPVTKFDFPILRSFVMDESGCLKMKWPEFKNSRSQDLENFYHDCGQWYWYNTTSINSQSFDKIKSVELDKVNVQDIDDLDDWALAELKYGYKYGSQKL